MPQKSFGQNICPYTDCSNITSKRIVNCSIFRKIFHEFENIVIKNLSAKILPQCEYESYFSV